MTKCKCKDKVLIGGAFRILVKRSVMMTLVRLCILGILGAVAHLSYLACLSLIAKCSQTKPIVLQCSPFSHST